MASNSNKVKDPTEVALSAIQEALNLNDPPSKATDIRIDPADDYRGNIAVDRTTVDHEPQHGYEPQPSPPAADFDQLEPPVQARRAANDDRETIGQILQTIQRGRPRRNAYTIATLFAGLWVATIGVLTFAFLPSLQSLIGAGGGGPSSIATLSTGST